MDTTLFTCLRDNMNARAFLTANAVEQGLDEGRISAARAEVIVSNYCRLAAEITRLLWRAKVEARTAGMEATATELDRNIAEEEGSRTGGVSHYQILLDGIAKELGFIAHGFVHEASTIELLEGIYALCARSVGHALGAAYALEASATPELLVVARILNRYATATDKRLPVSQSTLDRTAAKPGTRWGLDRFFAAHICDFEPGHEAGLNEALSHDLSEAQWADLEEGFLAVMDLMDNWWLTLATT